MKQILPDHNTSDYLEKQEENESGERKTETETERRAAHGNVLSIFHISFRQNSVTSQADEKVRLVYLQKIGQHVFILHDVIYGNRRGG